MPTNTDRIDELVRLVTQIVGRLDRIEGEVEWTGDLIQKTTCGHRGITTPNRGGRTPGN